MSDEVSKTATTAVAAKLQNIELSACTLVKHDIL
jgi:hypothetical protein